MSPSQEHFISELIKQKLYVLIDQISANTPTKENGCYFFLKMSFMKSGFFCQVHSIIKGTLRHLLRRQSLD